VYLLLARNTASCEAMFYAIRACIAAATCATAFEVKSEFVARFMLEVLDVPMGTESRSRRLQGIDWDDSLRNATPGEQISSLFHAAVDGTLSTSGRRLSYKPRSQAARNMAKWMDMTVNYNDDGCDHGKRGQRLAEQKAAKALETTRRGRYLVTQGKNSNQQAINEVKKLDQRKEVVVKMLSFLAGWVLTTLSGNVSVLGQSIRLIALVVKALGGPEAAIRTAVNAVEIAVDGLKWMGSKVQHFFGYYDVGALEAAISAPNAVALLPVPSSVTPNLKVFSVVKFPIVMVAGMVTMLALLVAGMRKWKKWNTSVDSMETDKMLVVDVVE